MPANPDLWALFASAFVSSTLLPGGSEIGLVWLAREAGHSPFLLLAVATLGNTLGGMTSWGLGRLLAGKAPAASFLKPAHRRAIDRLERRGSPILLLSWLPVIGDPLCVAAGWLRIAWWQSLIYITLGKAARYGVLLWGWVVAGSG